MIRKRNTITRFNSGLVKILKEMSFSIRIERTAGSPAEILNEHFSITSLERRWHTILFGSASFVRQTPEISPALRFPVTWKRPLKGHTFQSECSVLFVDDFIVRKAFGDL